MMIPAINSYRFCSAGLISLLLCSCSGDTSDLTRYMHEIKSRPAAKIEPIPKFAPLATFTFPENDNRRSPFKPIEPKKRIEESAPDQNRPKQPLEAFPLDALKFVGILKSGHQEWALIKQPNNQVLHVRVGDYMGQDFGRIVLIKSDMIKVEETIKDSGTWVKKTTTIELNTGK